jgi:ribosomal protein L10
MRPEKSTSYKEASEYLSQSDYFFLTDYKGIDSVETNRT